MCQILLQVYGCGHTKPVCNTPCPRALAISTSNPFLDPSSPHTPNTPRTPISPVYQAPDTPTPTRTCPQPLTAGPVPSPVSPQHPHTFQAAQFSQTQYRANKFNNFSEDREEGELTPSYCMSPHPKYLRPSKYPCLACYMQPQWTGYRSRWVGEYRS